MLKPYCWHYKIFVPSLMEITKFNDISMNYIIIQDFYGVWFLLVHICILTTSFWPLTITNKLISNRFKNKIYYLSVLYVIITVNKDYMKQIVENGHCEYQRKQYRFIWTITVIVLNGTFLGGLAFLDPEIIASRYLSKDHNTTSSERSINSSL